MQSQGRINRTGGGYVEFGFDSASHDVRTPGPGRATDPLQKLVVQFVGYLNRRDCQPEKLAADLMMQPVEIQAEVAKFVFAMLGMWSEFATCTSPQHPLANEYQTSAKMVNNLFR